MAARTKARKRALDVLFQADLKSVSAMVAMTDFEDRADGPTNPYTRTVVEGVVAHQTRIDDLLSTYSSGWTIPRMPAIDRNLLRIATWEILWGDIPTAVAIDEAVELSRDLSTDESPAFINGLLGQIAEMKDHLVLED